MRVVNHEEEGFQPVGSCWSGFVKDIFSGKSGIPAEIVEVGNDGDTKFLTRVSPVSPESIEGRIYQHKLFNPNEAALGRLHPTEKQVDMVFKEVNGIYSVSVQIDGQAARNPIFEMSTVLLQLEKLMKSGSGGPLASAA